MIYYMLLPLFLLLIPVFQVTIPDAIFFGKAGVELSLIFVVYAGFSLNPIGGGILSLLLGFFVDCVTGSVTGLFVFIYVFMFFLSKLFFSRINADRMIFIAIFIFVCIIFEGIFISSFHKILYGLNTYNNLLVIFLPQALVSGTLSPVFFKICNRVEVMLSGGDARPLERT